MRDCCGTWRVAGMHAGRVCTWQRLVFAQCHARAAATKGRTGASIALDSSACGSADGLLTLTNIGEYEWLDEKS